MKLSDVEPGKYLIKDIYDGKCFSNRCLSMGIYKGEIIEVLDNNKHIPIIAKVKGTKLSIGRGFGEKIEVDLYE